MDVIAKERRRTISLAERMNEIGRPTSGFDYMRLSLSVFILVWHSFLVTNGLAWTRDAILLPTGVVIRLALPMFFALSGFLVAGSLERNPSVPTFVLFRALRILPALAVEITLSAVVIGGLTTTLVATQYYDSAMFWSYFLNIVGWIHYNLPGVFTTNPDDTVNRSLWTIPSELECYLFLVGAALLRLYSGRYRLLFLVIGVYAAYLIFRVARNGALPGFQPMGGTVLSRMLIFYFMTGVVFYRFRDRIPFSLPLCLASIVVAVATLLFDQTVWLSLVPVAYVTVYLGLLNPPKIALLLRGDYSYGIYLYAYPIQQVYVYLFPGAPWYVNLALALPTTAIFAVFSWHAIERPALTLKRAFARRSPPPDAANRGLGPAG
ncbi:acyltransferase family protein [uncultured Sphingomonas sp.]|uniref:acyltransferase family protein n=1 Tax=uncultured Sphingomonas sp. TaxID=158754 RepID=UPI0035CB6F7A